MSLPIPLGPFTLHDPVGEGGMGVVWGGVHRDSGAAVAVKTVRKPASDWGTDTQARFEREVRAVAALEHPAIVRVLDRGTVPPAAAFASQGRLVEGEPWLAMEFVSGGSLRDRLGAVPFDALRGLLLELLGGLAHAHARGVIHKDVKPANVLLAGPGDLRPGPKLVDFGIAALGRRAVAGDEDEDDDGPAGGSPSWTAPEQYEAGAPVGPSADLYALACTAWAAATGTPPYGRGERTTLIRRHLAGGLPRFVPASPCPPGFGDWLRALIQPDPADRPRHAADAADALREVGPTGGATAGATRPGGGTGPRCRPVAADWRTRAQPPLPDPLKGAGRGLLRLRRPPLVGRELERDALWRLLRGAAAGESGGVMLLGPAGCGKSRLAKWLAERADEEGLARPLWARHSGGPRDGFGPALARLAGTGDADRTTARTLLAARLGRLGDERIWLADAAVDALGPAASRATRAGRSTDREAAVLEWLAVEAAEQPLLLIVDDADAGAAASPSLSLAESLLGAAIPGIGVVVCARERPDDLGPALSELPARRLGGLEGRAIREIVDGLLHLHESLAARVVASADGNPLFACQLLADIAARDQLQPTADGFVARDGRDQPLPDSLHGLWMERLRGVDGDDPRPLELAALLGRTVDRAEWKAACERVGCPPDPGFEARLADAGFLRWVPGGWRFAHPLGRESVERRSDEAGRRQDLASACADVIGDAVAAAGRPAAGGARRGRLLLLAGRGGEAECALLDGAVAARERGDNRHAAELLQERDKALDRLGLPDEHERRALGQVLGMELRLREGRWVDAFARTEALAETARRNGWGSILAWCDLFLGIREREHGRLEAAAERARSARAGFEAAGSRRGVGAAWMDLGYTLKERGDYAGSHEAFAAALPIWEAMGLPGRIALTLGGIAGTHFEQGRLDLAAEGFERARELLQHTGRLEERAAMLHDLAGVRLMQGDLAEAEQLCDRALALRQSLNNDRALAPTWNTRGELARRRGRFDEAETCYRKAVALFEASGSTMAVHPRINLGLLSLERGDYAEARGVLADALADVEGKGRGSFADALQPVLLACAAGTGDWPEFDVRLGEVARFEPGVTRVDVDTARCLDLASRLAREAGEEARSNKARGMATLHWRALEG